MSVCGWLVVAMGAVVAVWILSLVWIFHAVEDADPDEENFP